MATSLSVYYQSPLGKLRIESDGECLTAIQFTTDEDSTSSQQVEAAIFSQVTNQLDEYFEGSRTNFDLPLAPEGTDFQRQVWEQLLKIPYGQTINYGELAQRLGDANKVRAVGTANGKNPIPIIIPCHRVIGANNNLVGYRGGIDRKKKLLKHEGALLL